MPRGKSAIGTYFSARKGESSHRKSLTLEVLDSDFLGQRTRPSWEESPEQSANATRLSQGDYMFLKKRTPPKKSGLMTRSLLGQAVSWFSPDDKVKKRPLFPARFRTEDLSRVRRAWPLHYGNSHCSPVWDTQFLLRWIMKRISHLHHIRE